MTPRQMELLSQLTELDPLRSYPRRGVAALAELAGADGYRAEIGKDVLVSSPSPVGSASAELPLRAGDEHYGTVHFYGVLARPALAQCGATMLANGIRNARRLDANGSPRTYEDVQAMLERTPLTPRERDVVGRLLSGSSTREIATSTGLTIATVNTYLKRIFAKLGVHSRVELVARVTGTQGVIPAAPSPGDSSQAT